MGRQIRFVAVSASVSSFNFSLYHLTDEQVPNIEDVAHWLGTPAEEAEDVGFEEAGGIRDSEGTKSISVKPPQPTMAKVLKVS